MQKILLTLTLFVFVVSCSKESSKENQPLTTKIRQQRIEAALNTSNPNRLVLAEKILLMSPTPSGYTLKEVVATNKETGLKSFGYILVKENNPITELLVNPNFGSYTGWMLYNNGCWYHGTMYWSGTTTNFLFVADPNPYTDNIIGNEPRCMSDAEFDTYC